MEFIPKIIAKIILNGIALYIAKTYFPDFVLAGGIDTFVIAAVLLALLNMFVRPILRLVSTPLIWLSFGLFNIVIHVLILWIADQFLTQLAINSLSTLFWASIIIALANTFF